MIVDATVRGIGDDSGSSDWGLYLIILAGALVVLPHLFVKSRRIS